MCSLLNDTIYLNYSNQDISWMELGGPIWANKTPECSVRQPSYDICSIIVCRPPSSLQRRCCMLCVTIVPLCWNNQGNTSPTLFPTLVLSQNYNRHSNCCWKSSLSSHPAAIGVTFISAVVTQTDVFDINNGLIVQLQAPTFNNKCNVWVQFHLLHVLDTSYFSFYLESKYKL